MALGTEPIHPVNFADSYYRFFTEPRLTVYMPDDGQPLSPYSVFSRVLGVLTRGGIRPPTPIPRATDPGLLLPDGAMNTSSRFTA